ncbi:MAG: hypothetical protein PHY82_03585 [Lentisphaeria bacterium]|nr:hypothetical protein [Lentisphaeria bacterium]
METPEKGLKISPEINVYTMPCLQRKSNPGNASAVRKSFMGSTTHARNQSRFHVFFGSFRAFRCSKRSPALPVLPGTNHAEKIHGGGNYEIEFCSMKLYL